MSMCTSDCDGSSGVDKADRRVSFMMNSVFFVGERVCECVSGCGVGRKDMMYRVE
jgi:hypothetical protein